MNSSFRISVTALCSITILLLAGCTSFKHQTSETEPHALVFIPPDRDVYEYPTVTQIDGLLVQLGREYRVTPGEHQLIISEMVLVGGRNDKETVRGGPGESLTVSVGVIQTGSLELSDSTKSITLESGWRYVLEGWDVHKTSFSNKWTVKAAE